MGKSIESIFSGNFTRTREIVEINKFGPWNLLWRVRRPIYIEKQLSKKIDSFLTTPLNHLAKLGSRTQKHVNNCSKKFTSHLQNNNGQIIIEELHNQAKSQTNHFEPPPGCCGACDTGCLKTTDVKLKDLFLNMDPIPPYAQSFRVVYLFTQSSEFSGIFGPSV